MPKNGVQQHATFVSSTGDNLGAEFLEVIELIDVKGFLIQNS